MLFRVLQERVLENLAIFLPLEIETAWLEEARAYVCLHPYLSKLLVRIDLKHTSRLVSALWVKHPFQILAPLNR